MTTTHTWTVQDINARLDLYIQRGYWPEVRNLFLRYKENMGVRDHILSRTSKNWVELALEDPNRHVMPLEDADAKGLNLKLAGIAYKRCDFDCATLNQVNTLYTEFEACNLQNTNYQTSVSHHTTTVLTRCTGLLYIKADDGTILVFRDCPDLKVLINYDPGYDITQNSIIYINKQGHTHQVYSVDDLPKRLQKRVESNILPPPKPKSPRSLINIWSVGL